MEFTFSISVCLGSLREKHAFKLAGKSVLNKSMGVSRHSYLSCRAMHFTERNYTGFICHQISIGDGQHKTPPHKSKTVGGGGRQLMGRKIYSTHKYGIVHTHVHTHKYVLRVENMLTGSSQSSSKSIKAMYRGPQTLTMPLGYI